MVIKPSKQRLRLGLRLRLLNTMRTRIGKKKTGSLASEFQFNETACTSYIRPGCMAALLLHQKTRNWQSVEIRRGFDLLKAKGGSGFGIPSRPNQPTHTMKRRAASGFQSAAHSGLCGYSGGAPGSRGLASRLSCGSGVHGPGISQAQSSSHSRRICKSAGGDSHDSRTACAV